MLFFRPKFLIVVFALATNGKIGAFSDNECLKSTFKTEISHRGFPLGLTQRILSIEKKDCQLEIRHQKWKFFKRHWTADVCREPVHLKETTGSVEVIKKTASCTLEKSGQNPFCQNFGELKNMIQDDGLIFALGDKEELASEHGKVYCAYLLLLAYAERGIIFSRSKEYAGILERKRPKRLEGKPEEKREEKRAELQKSPTEEELAPPPDSPQTEPLPFDEKDSGSF